ncbi:MAG TPA: ribosome biogenesis GTPase Der, partial [Gammaproteobacteria bacterium]|nr:ribosome biogenesis GTPase Der [Gammaproteobacteria bacterium]
MKSLTLAIVGRANVGKSTLFNCLTRSRNALVADKEGLTRDRLYGNCVLEGIPYQVIDTCGVDGEQNEELSHFMDQQVQNAVVEADCALMVVDGQKGLLAEDIALAKRLRIANKKTYIVVNKAEGKEPTYVCAEFYALGFDKVFAISAAHNQGILTMMEEVAQDNQLSAPEETTSDSDLGLKIAILGRPNVGKSTLINRLLQEDRVVVFDMPGTTRDSIYIPFKRHQKNYTLIDTAGVRRKSRVSDLVEKFSAIKTLQAMQDADCVILVLNAHEDLYDQDLNLLR